LKADKKGKTAMGYNRSGTRRKQRLKRHKRELTRIVAKLEAANEAKASDPTKKPVAAKK
jgi:hypothetical protein